MHTTPKSRRRFLWGSAAAAVLLAVLIGSVLWLRTSAGPYGRARRAWKDRAVAEIAVRAADAGALASAVEALRASAREHPESDAWIGQDLLLMKNGDWIAYASICGKEDPRIPDLFIGRGSDGKWYFSTFHFCRQMIVLRDDEQPESLEQFADWYYLEEFDGRSDACLARTWPVSRSSDPKAAKRGPW